MILNWSNLFSEGLNIFHVFTFEQEGAAIFDARQLNNNVFTITDGELMEGGSPVRIMLKPPSYEEAVTALGEYTWVQG